MAFDLAKEVANRMRVQFSSTWLVRPAHAAKSSGREYSWAKAEWRASRACPVGVYLNILLRKTVQGQGRAAFAATNMKPESQDTPDSRPRRIELNANHRLKPPVYPQTLPVNFSGHLPGSLKLDALQNRAPINGALELRRNTVPN
jgi:hypothetical protein